MRIGFIGTGVITQAIVRGIVSCGFPVERIALSPRSATVGAELARMDVRVQVCASNQGVLDAADIVCIAVIPQIVHEVMRELIFDPRHRVITFTPGTPAALLRELALPAASLTRAIPLPAVADGKGCTAIYPPDETARRLFSALGTAVEVGEEHHFDAIHATTATMASFYAVLEQQALWLTQQGVPYEAARSFLSGYCIGLANETAQTKRSFSEMIDYFMTPGGLNEQVHAELSAQAAYSHYGKALDRILSRIQGHTTA